MNKKIFLKIFVFFLLLIFIKCETEKVAEYLDAFDIFETEISCIEGEPCDDKNPCTINDKCINGVCIGEEIIGCDDGIYCTMDSCDELSCEHKIIDGFCLIDGKCYKNGDLNPENECEECIVIISNEKWSFDDTNKCDDKNSCTFDDHCSEGKCIGKLKKCDDKNPCTEDFCNENGDCVYKNIEGDCNDGNLCTIDDKCNNGKCTGAEISCDDKNPCTDEYCDPIKGCVFEFNNKECDDGNICTNNDKCIKGLCKSGSEILKCDDENPCTDGWCVPEKGCVYIPNSAPCDDGNACFSGDICKGGKCISGKIPLICNDNNPCTDDVCEKNVGCVYVPNTISCDDGDPCFSGDFCKNGVCQKGPIPLECDDGNPCTKNSCKEGKGCDFEPLSKIPCDDFSMCTENDKCENGMCKGNPIKCDDNNNCTDNGCDPATGCIYTPLKIAECMPEITIIYPQRAATLKGNSLITVKGKVKSPAAPVKYFKINGTSTSISEDGSFSFNINSKQGMNIIVGDVEDNFGGKDHVVQSYYFSNVYYPIDVLNPEQSMVKDGLMVFLSPSVWDDNDTSDIDDIATIMTLYVDNLDINSVIKNPVKEGKFGWCEYKVNITNIKKGKASVDLKPVNGGLYLYAKIPNFSADISVPTEGTLCPDFNGKATASYISISTNLQISIDESGNINVLLQNTDVQIHDLDIKLGGIWGFLLNWLINFFENTIANMIEKEFEKQLGGMISSAVKNALLSLAISRTFEIKPPMGKKEPAKLDMKTKISSLKFTENGSDIGMSATIVTPKNIEHNPLGSIGRSSCLNPVQEIFNFPMKTQIEMALYDDFLNQIPFGMYWGGLFKFDISESDIGQNLEEYGITDFKMSIDFLLPPIITGCPGTLHVQIGDIFIPANFKLFTLPINMEMFATIDGEAELFVATTPQGKEIGLKLKKITFIDIEIAKISGELKGAEEIISKLIKEKIMPDFLNAFGEKAFGTFPVPEIELSGMHPSIPPGTKISLDLQEILRIFGYTVLTGNIK